MLADPVWLLADAEGTPIILIHTWSWDNLSSCDPTKDEGGSTPHQGKEAAKFQGVLFAFTTREKATRFVREAGTRVPSGTTLKLFARGLAVSTPVFLRVEIDPEVRPEWRCGS